MPGIGAGGETEFADMRAAYDALPEAMKSAIDGLVAEHDIFWSRGQMGFTDFLPGEREKYPPSRQRLVRRHPGRNLAIWIRPWGPGRVLIGGSGSVRCRQGRHRRGQNRI
jgi:alpha-ketoglutarate-dependent taurine dioxygenase